MATLILGYGRRNSTTGRLERLSGRFESNVPGKQYTEVFVTDCTKTVKIDGRILPGAHQVFSFSHLAAANNQLNLGGDLYVYVRAKGALGTLDDYSNVYELDKGKGYSDRGDLKQLKADNIAALQDQRASLDQLINILDSMATLNQSLPLAIGGGIDGAITDAMAELARGREQIEDDLRKKQAWYDEMFGKGKRAHKRRRPKRR